MNHQNQFSLLQQKRFAPFFITQLLGAFNDNVYKNALVALVGFVAIRESAQNTALIINLSAGLFILPFFLFSALSGQIADKYEKSFLIQRIKLAEIVIMLCGVIAFVMGSVPMLIAILFLLGVQSTFFGPIKYGILPQHLKESELVGGNGLVELGTFLAILLGTIAGTQLITKPANGTVIPIAVVIVVVAIAGYISSRSIPAATPSDPDLKIRFNPATETWKLVSYTHTNRVIFQSILGISWFWFMGATYLAQFPLYARDVLGGTADLYTLLLALFSIGIGIGSGLCEKLSGNQVEIGLVPFGALGLTIFGLDLVWATPSEPFGQQLGVVGFFAVEGAWRVAIDIVMLGLFGGFYIVPLYALIQKTSASDRLSRAMACNNIINALFMVLSAVVVMMMFAAGFSIVQVFFAMAIMNALVAAYIFRLVPEFLMRFLIWMLVHTLYRVRKTGLEKIPEKGSVVLAPNHVSFVDPLIIGGCVSRPVRFVMYYKIYQVPVLNFIFRTARAIPIAGAKEDKAMYDRAFKEMCAAVDAGDVLCIFPEGQITHDGQLNTFRGGIEKLLELRPVPVIPVALQGLWGSLFSRKDGPAFFKRPRRMFARINMLLGDAIAPENVSASGLQQAVEKLRGDKL